MWWGGREVKCAADSNVTDIIINVSHHTYKVYIQ